MYVITYMTCANIHHLYAFQLAKNFVTAGNYRSSVNWRFYTPDKGKILTRICIERDNTKKEKSHMERVWWSPMR